MPYITLLLTLLLLSGCVSSPRTHAPARTDSLQPWLDNTLSPWLTEQLARHPRFKGRTGQLVAMQEHRLQPAIDGLRDEVRQQLFNRLISQPGVQLAWYPDDAPLEHHRSLAQLQCARPRQADFYIGLDIRAGLNGDSHLAIRALEPGASQWMSGFGLQWQGRLTASQQQALQQQRADESLRGLRALPFTGQQADLLAAYLARNFGCLLQQQYQLDASEISLYIAPSSQQAPWFQRLNRLLQNYLARFPEIQLSRQPHTARVQLQLEVVPIHGQLFQLWVNTTLQPEGRVLSGTDTAAYLQLTDIDRLMEQPLPPTTTAASTLLTPIAPVPATIEPAVQQSEVRFQGIRPRQPKRCGHPAPWANGYSPLKNGQTFYSADCMGLQIQQPRPGWGLVYHQDSSGLLTMLWPHRCQPGEDDFRIPKQFELPRQSEGAGAVYNFRADAGQERFTLLTSANYHDIARLWQQLNRRAGLCRNSEPTAYTRSPLGTMPLPATVRQHNLEFHYLGAYPVAQP